MTAIIHLDFETASTVDLRKAGVYAYADHPETRILCAAWKINDQPVQSCDYNDFSPMLKQLVPLMAGQFYFCAHNAEFEWVIWGLLGRHFAIPAIPLKVMRCTMARALYWGLPAPLDKAVPAAKLPKKYYKDTDGHKLMLRMARPRALVGPANTPRWWHVEDPARLARLRSYCEQDVEAEAALNRHLPWLPSPEQDLWELNCEMNARGIGVDLPLVDKLLDNSAQATADLNKIIVDKTNGEVPTAAATAKLKRWLNANGCPGQKSVDRAHIQEIVNNKKLPPRTRLVAGARLLASKTSVRKLESMRKVAGATNVLRGLTAYYGASRTGRYAGRLTQPHNMPRGKLPHKALKAVRAHVLCGQRPTRKFQKHFKCPELDVYSSLLRTTFVAPSIHDKLYIGDFSQIEARVLAWLCKHTKVLDRFHRQVDIYVGAAQDIGSNDRQLGKVLTLACGYGMGAAKFHQTATEVYGLTMDEHEAKKALTTWRMQNACIINFWYKLEESIMAFLTMPQPSTRKKINATYAARWGLEFKHAGYDPRTFQIVLPSGRPLNYYDCEIIPTNRQHPRDPFPNQLRPQPHIIVYKSYRQGHWVDEHTYGGKLVENVVQAVARDILAAALREVDAHPMLRPVLTVHDEIIATGPADREQELERDLKAIMSTTPLWAKGLPVEADVFSSFYYRK